MSAVKPNSDSKERAVPIIIWKHSEAKFAKNSDSTSPDENMNETKPRAEKIYKVPTLDIRNVLT